MTQQPDSLQSDETLATEASADSPYAGVDGPGHAAAGEPAPDVAEEFAESIPIDPTPDQVEHYLDLVGEADDQP
jgi:hypothetical protein